MDGKEILANTSMHSTPIFRTKADRRRSGADPQPLAADRRRTDTHAGSARGQAVAESAATNEGS
jgi:hypothetical protein